MEKRNKDEVAAKVAKAFRWTRKRKIRDKLQDGTV